MSQFDTEKFMSEPYKDPFYVLKKDELISLAKHLKLEVKKAKQKKDSEYHGRTFSEFESLREQF